MTNNEALEILNKGIDTNAMNISGDAVYVAKYFEAITIAVKALEKADRYEKLLNVVDEYNLMSDWMCEELAEMTCNPSGECWCDACRWSSPTRECIERWLDCK